MTRPPSKNQLADLWMAEYQNRGFCLICGNSGVIDTTGKMKTPAGHVCGGRAFCICPNGRTMKRKGCTL